ncbi:putative ferric-chelate reductase 1 isoform X2 [Xenopus tropicalis]|uniref:Ferric-chelate reductase 1 isoform X2 n=1 Tax=Xenopus tropicalis TaxID=8364 RepID=A0A8J1JIM9_XENTR|nr:putative ferric-chelate reductase 1 isoform X2 [Xenopus tropicalis]
MRYKVFGLLVFWLLINSVQPFGNGNVGLACDTMMPNHRTHAAQESMSPYRVAASSYSFSPGDEITVTLLANFNTTFEGFLLQARSVTGNRLVGNFRVLNSNSQILDCGGVMGLAVSHINTSKKSNITALWTAPDLSDNVHFRATFVRNFKTFWVGVESPLLTFITPSNQRPTTPNVPAVYVLSTNLPSNKVGSTIISRESCGTDKVCFSVPTDCDPSRSTNCYFMSSSPIETSGQGYLLGISGPSTGYVSVGFSDDMQMGNDDMYLCVMNAAGVIEVQHAYSEGKSQPRVLTPGNIEVILASYNNGIIQCTFIARSISILNPLQNSRSINSLYHIFLAYGSSSNGQVQYHGPSGRFISNSRIDLLAASNVTSGPYGLDPLVKAHGSLMLIAWMTTGSLGMILARYFKVTGKQLVLGKAVWFQAHFFLMALTVCATIASFVLAFVKEQGWNYNLSTHAIIGCIVMCLAFFQPLIALFRPSPQSSRRFIFNWFHVINALVIKVLAVANLFLGLQVVSHTYAWMPEVMGGFFAWEALAFISLEINAQMAEKETGRYDVNDDPKSKSPAKTDVFLLLIYLCGNLAFLITLLVAIGRS